jgi:drug/metabolite transporter (DMT)-like permease
MAMFWGASWPIGRVLALELPPLSASSFRFVIASAALLTWLVLSQGWPRLGTKQWASLALAGSVGVSAYSVCYMLAMQTVEASRGAMVVAINPVFTTVLAAWWFKERFNLTIAMGLCVAVLGGMIVLSHGAPWRIFAGQLGVGEWLLLGCIAAWVTYTLLSRSFTANIAPLAASTMATVFGTLIMIVLALIFEGPALMRQALQSMGWKLWANTLVLALGAGVLAYAWYGEGIAKLGAGPAAAYICLVPVFGVALSTWSLGEQLDVWLWVGGAMAVLGLSLNQLGRTRRDVVPSASTVAPKVAATGAVK